MNCIDAVKEKKNSYIVVAALVFIKAGITVLFCFTLFSTYEKIMDIQGMINAANELKEYDYYEIQTPAALEEEMIQQINEYLNTVDNNYIYNYSSPDLSYRKSDLADAGRIAGYETVCDSNYMSISDNLLHNFKIKKTDGTYVKKEELNGEALLVPEYLQEEVKDILEWLSFDKTVKVLLVENGQCYSDMVYPGLFYCNPIVYVHSPVKEIYINSGEVLYDKSVVDEIKEYFNKIEIGAGSISIHSRSDSIDTFIAGYNIKLFESILFSVIMLFTFVLTDFAMITVYIQYNKKEIGVMVLHGKRVILSTWKFLLLLIMIDLISAMAINICFIVLIFIDVFIYWSEMNKTLKHGTTRLINGL